MSSDVGERKEDDVAGAAVMGTGGGDGKMMDVVDLNEKSGMLLRMLGLGVAIGFAASRVFSSSGGGGCKNMDGLVAVEPARTGFVGAETGFFLPTGSSFNVAI